MIYTIGHKLNYLAAIQRAGTIQKLGRRAPGEHLDYPNGYPGGYAFKTWEDAQRKLAEDNRCGEWAIWGLDADWERDTVPTAEGWWHDLIHDADILILPESEP